jgi:hypothetical protein
LNTDDVAMPKRGRKRPDMDDWERETMVLGIQSMREPSSIEYTAPGAEQKWRARDLLDIHWKLTGIEIPSESYTRIKSCIIGHANPTTGRCQLKQKLIAAETGYCVKTVKRVTDWWESKGFLKVQDVGLARSKAYHPQWDLFELYYFAIAGRNRSHEGILVKCLGGLQGVHRGGLQGVHRRWTPRCRT